MLSPRRRNGEIIHGIRNGHRQKRLALTLDNLMNHGENRHAKLSGPVIQSVGCDVGEGHCQCLVAREW